MIILAILRFFQTAGTIWLKLGIKDTKVKGKSRAPEEALAKRASRSDASSDIKSEFPGSQK